MALPGEGPLLAQAIANNSFVMEKVVIEGLDRIAGALGVAYHAFLSIDVQQPQ